jgi:carbonic anhydrase/acetyltransferase-like protein (isoleucine patch superfamily)
LIGQVEVAEDCSIWPYAVLRGDGGRISVGKGSNIQDGVIAHLTEDLSSTRVGDYCTIGHRAILHGCIVGDFSVVGMGAILLDNAELGEYCMVGSGALITAGKKFPPYSLIMGSPAKAVREITQKEKDYIDLGWRTYYELAQNYLRQGVQLAGERELPLR